MTTDGLAGAGGCSRRAGVGLWLGGGSGSGRLWRGWSAQGRVGGRLGA